MDARAAPRPDRDPQPDDARAADEARAAVQLDRDAAPRSGLGSGEDASIVAEPSAVAARRQAHRRRAAQHVEGISRPSASSATTRATCPRHSTTRASTSTATTLNDVPRAARALEARHRGCSTTASARRVGQLYVARSLARPRPRGRRRSSSTTCAPPIARRSSNAAGWTTRPARRRSTSSLRSIRASATRSNGSIIRR